MKPRRKRLQSSKRKFRKSENRLLSKMRSLKTSKSCKRSSKLQSKEHKCESVSSRRSMQLNLSNYKFRKR